jgi:hypothetical protein
MKGVMKGCMQIIGALLALFLMPGLLQAKIPDNMTCSTCHTMHNSQDGLALNAVTPYGLLVSSCVACHTGSSGTSPRNTLTEAPAVMHSSGAPGSTSGTDNMLAGRSFYWVATGGGATDNTGHNVIGLAALDFGLGNVPPGGTALGSELTCAGTYGCHGVRDSTNEVAAIKGAHHTNDNEPLDGSTIGKSYRFLSSVIGTEDTDWEYTFASNDHNQYKGGATYSSIAIDTITSVCRRCHADYHGNPGVGSGSSPWIRHPTDIDLPSTGEYANYVTYEAFVPVASSTGLALVTNNVQTGSNGIVTCISCHRAHGSPYDSLMRWDYRAWPGSVDPLNGCGVCHSSKD